MGISRRGNFALPLNSEADNESRLAAFEAEWAAQWEPTTAETNSEFKQAFQPHASADSRAKLDIVISLRSRQALRIRVVA